MRKLGILGGTFDPVHFGHLVIAEEARCRLGLAEVRFIPAGRPPHKADQLITPAAHRLAMVRLATATNPAFAVATLELRRAGPSFTVDTLAELQASEGPDVALYFIAGGDALAELLTWHQPERILELATLVVVQRPGTPAVNLAALEARLPTLRRRLVLLEGPRFDVSGTELRERVRLGLPTRYQVPDAVLAYIAQHGLYRDEGTGRLGDGGKD